MLPRDGLSVRTASSTQPRKKVVFPTQPDTIIYSASHVQMLSAPYSHHPRSNPPRASSDTWRYGHAELEFQKFRNKGSGWCTRMVYGLRNWVGRLGWGNNPSETALQCQCRSGMRSYSNLVKPQLFFALDAEKQNHPSSSSSLELFQLEQHFSE